MGIAWSCAAALLLLTLLSSAAHRAAWHPPLAARGLVLVTGASSGIGRSAALSLARAHPQWTVLAGVRRREDAAAVEAEAANVRGLLLDVADARSRAGAAAAVLALQASHGPLLALVNNAGVARSVPAELHDLADARAVFEVNFFGLLGLTQALLPALRASRGRIVQLSSMAGRIATPLNGIYAASKFAVEAVSDALRRELAGAVSVTVVQPAFVRSAIFRADKAAASTLSGGDDAARAAYPHLYTAARTAALQSELDAAASTDCTDAAIGAALTDARPLARVQVAHASGVPATVIAWLAWALPDRVFDLIS